MIRPIDEFIHERGKEKDWLESFNLSFADKKSRVFVFADLDYHRNKKAELLWHILIKDQEFNYNKIIESTPSSNSKKLGAAGLTYKIIKPAEQIELTLKNEFIDSKLTFSRICPTYRYPNNFITENSGSSVNSPDAALNAGNNPSKNPIIKLNKPKDAPLIWDIYETRSRVKGHIHIKKGTKKKIDCFGQRSHSWGSMLEDKITSKSKITIQFRDFSLSLYYIEAGAVPLSHGYASKRSCNIPIEIAGFESLTFSMKKKSLSSTEFSYKDAGDDVDLIVSKAIHTTMIPLPKNKKSGFVKFKSFSEFTIIGAGKKGIGLEEHLISLDKLKSMDDKCQ